MELVNIENGRVLVLQPGTLTVLGRGQDCGITSLNISRRHCTIYYEPSDRDSSSNISGAAEALANTLGAQVRLTVVHASGAAVVRGLQGRQLGLEPLLLLAVGSSCQLLPGDRVYLERRDARLVSGLELRATGDTAGCSNRGGRESPMGLPQTCRTHTAAPRSQAQDRPSDPRVARHVRVAAEPGGASATTAHDVEVGYTGGSYRGYAAVQAGGGESPSDAGVQPRQHKGSLEAAADTPVDGQSRGPPQSRPPPGPPSPSRPPLEATEGALGSGSDGRTSLPPAARPVAPAAAAVAGPAGGLEDQGCTAGAIAVRAGSSLGSPARRVPPSLLKQHQQQAAGTKLAGRSDSSPRSPAAKRHRVAWAGAFAPSLPSQPQPQRTETRDREPAPGLAPGSAAAAPAAPGVGTVGPGPAGQSRASQPPVAPVGGPAPPPLLLPTCPLDAVLEARYRSPQPQPARQSPGIQESPQPVEAHLPPEPATAPGGTFQRKRQRSERSSAESPPTGGPGGAAVGDSAGAAATVTTATASTVAQPGAALPPAGRVSAEVSGEAEAGSRPAPVGEVPQPPSPSAGAWGLRTAAGAAGAQPVERPRRLGQSVTHLYEGSAVTSRAAAAATPAGPGVGHTGGRDLTAEAVAEATVAAFTAGDPRGLDRVGGGGGDSGGETGGAGAAVGTSDRVLQPQGSVSPAAQIHAAGADWADGECGGGAGQVAKQRAATAASALAARQSPQASGLRPDVVNPNSVEMDAVPPLDGQRAAELLPVTAAGQLQGYEGKEEAKDEEPVVPGFGALSLLSEAQVGGRAVEHREELGALEPPQQQAAATEPRATPPGEGVEARQLQAGPQPRGCGAQQPASEPTDRHPPSPTEHAVGLEAAAAAPTAPAASLPRQPDSGVAAAGSGAAVGGTAAGPSGGGPAAGDAGSTGGKARPGGSRNLFSGCRFVFWARSQSRDVLVRVKQAGGQEQYSVGPGTTHVVASYDTSAEEAAQLLRSSDLEYDSAAAVAAPASATAGLPPGLQFVTPGYLRDCLAQGRRLEPDPAAGHLIQIAAQLPAPQAHPQHAARQHPATAPQPQLAAAGIALPAGERAGPAMLSPRPAAPAPLPPQNPPLESPPGPTHHYRPEEQRDRAAAPPRPSPVEVGGTMVGDLDLDLRQGLMAAAAAGPAAAPADEQVAVGASAAAAAPGNLASPDEKGGGRVLPGPEEICARPEDWGRDNRWIEPWDPEAAARTCMLILSHWAKHSYQAEGDPSSPAASAAADAAGGDVGAVGRAAADVSGGHAGRGVGGGVGGAMSGFGTPQTPRSGPRRRRRQSTDTETSSEGEDQACRGGRGGGAGGSTAAMGTAPAAAGSERVNAVCAHRCCAARPFCILAELKRTRDLYMGREDQFRIKAIDRAMGVLVRLGWPLESPDQLRQLHLGKASEEKVAAILATGRFSRNDAYEHNEMRMTLKTFLLVWGCGESTARSWWASGARSLDDVRQRTDLTVQQRLGLRHFDDFQRRIPRAEVDQVATVVRQTTVDALRALTQLPDEALLDRLHVRPMGSYARGSPSSSDVDFIIAPSLQADPGVGPYELLVAIVGRLEAGGYLDVESARMIETRQDHFRNPHRPSPVRPSVRLTHGSTSGEANGGAVSGAEGGGDDGDGDGAPARTAVESSTWLGVWRLPSSGRYVRVDIKCYRRHLLPFAVNYFSSGMDFNRALRYWANAPVARVRELARRLYPRASAFRLSDKELTVVERRVGPGPGSRMVPVDYILGTVSCSCETDIFRALGLDYVPPHMRDITLVE